MSIEVEIEDNDQILIGEAVLGTLEAFFATLIEHEIAPHAECFRVTVNWGDDAVAPSVQTNELDLSCAVTWPLGLPFPRYAKERDARMLLLEIAAQTMAATCVVRDRDAFLESLFADEAVQQRIALITAAPNSYSRVNAHAFARLSDWQKAVRRSYPPREARAEVPSVELGSLEEARGRESCGDSDPLAVRSHKGVWRCAQ